MRKGDKLWYVYIFLPLHKGEVLGPFTSHPVAERHTRTWLDAQGVHKSIEDLMYVGDVCFDTTEIVE